MKKIIIYLVLTALLCIFSSYAAAGFSEDYNDAVSKPKLEKLKTQPLKTKNETLTGPFERPKTEKIKLQKPETKKWWQWSKKETKKKS